MKIFVTVGTQNQQFNRLFEMVDQLEIDAQVKIQTGSSDYKSNKYECCKYIKDFQNEITTADLIICHGGIGSILTALKESKKVIAIPRLSKYGEHVNDHQTEIVEEYTEIGYIKMATNKTELQQIIDEIDDFIPKKYKSNNELFISKLEEVINKLC